MNASTQISFNRDPARLPLRELPHGSWNNVFLLYTSYCKTAGDPVASRSTFFAVAKVWRVCLRFHKKSQHQLCETCSRLKMRIRHAAESCSLSYILFSSTMYISYRLLVWGLFPPWVPSTFRTRRIICIGVTYYYSTTKEHGWIGNVIGWQENEHGRMATCLSLSLTRMIKRNAHFQGFHFQGHQKSPFTSECTVHQFVLK